MKNAPAYVKVYSRLKNEINKGTYPVGGFLPKECELEKIYQVSRTTVRNAVKMLVQEGLVEVRQGSGTRVLNHKAIQNYNKVTSVTESLMKKGYRVTTSDMMIDIISADKQLADELEIPVDKISDTLKVSGRHISVDAPFVEGEDNSLLDVLVNDDSPMADRSLVNESLSREIDRALSTLTEREKDIIQMFFGINTQEMTLEEIGDKFGLTRERVRQIKEKAIRRLRQNSRSKLLKSYLG